MREIVHLQAGQCGNQIGAKVRHMAINIISALVGYLHGKMFDNCGHHPGRLRHVTMAPFCHNWIFGVRFKCGWKWQLCGTLIEIILILLNQVCCYSWQPIEISIVPPGMVVHWVSDGFTPEAVFQATGSGQLAGLEIIRCMSHLLAHTAGSRVLFFFPPDRRCLYDLAGKKITLARPNEGQTNEL